MYLCPVDLTPEGSEDWVSIYSKIHLRGKLFSSLWGSFNRRIRAFSLRPQGFDFPMKAAVCQMAKWSHFWKFFFPPRREESLLVFWNLGLALLCHSLQCFLWGEWETEMGSAASWTVWRWGFSKALGHPQGTSLSQWWPSRNGRPQRSQESAKTLEAGVLGCDFCPICRKPNFILFMKTCIKSTH